MADKIYFSPGITLPLDTEDLRLNRFPVKGVSNMTAEIEEKSNSIHIKFEIPDIEMHPDGFNVDVDEWGKKEKAYIKFSDIAKREINNLNINGLFLSNHATNEGQMRIIFDFVVTAGKVNTKTGL